jgi:cardiolipin synthase (CMP-forming)
LSLAAELLAWERPRAAPYLAALALVAAECVAISFVQYFIYFVRSARHPTV